MLHMFINCATTSFSVNSSSYQTWFAWSAYVYILYLYFIKNT